jgi:hypothetical protein
LGLLLFFVCAQNLGNILDFFARARPLIPKFGIPLTPKLKTGGVEDFECHVIDPMDPYLDHPFS